MRIKKVIYNIRKAVLLLRICSFILQKNKEENKENQSEIHIDD